MPRGKQLQTSIAGFGFIFKPTYTRKGVKKQSAIWHMAYTTDDGQVRRSTEQTDQAAAYAELSRVFARRTEGQVRNSAPERVTFGDLFKLVERDYKRNKLHSISNLMDRITKHLNPVFGDMLVIKLKKSHIEDFRERAGRNLSVATVNRCVAIIRRALQIGAEEDPPLVTRAIPDWFKATKEDNTRTGIVTDELYRAVLPHMAPHVRTAFVIGYYVGMRLGEILSLRWEQIDFAAGLIVLEKKQTKAKKGRTAPIYEDMRAVLEMAKAQCPNDCSYVIQESGRRVQSIKTAFAAAWERAGMLVDTGRLRKDGQPLLKPPVLFHDLRRTAATNMIRAGIAPDVIMNIVGWKSPAMLKRYGILDETDTVAAGRQMEVYWGRMREAAATPKPRYLA